MTMRVSIAVILVLVTSFSCTGAIKQKNGDSSAREKPTPKAPAFVLTANGAFRGLSWSTPFETVKDEMTYLRGEGKNIKTYSRKGDSMQIGTIKVEKIEYHFWEGLLGSISIEFFGWTTYTELMENAKVKYGTPHRSLTMEASYDTFDDKESHIRIKFNKTTGYGSIYLSAK